VTVANQVNGPRRAAAARWRGWPPRVRVALAAGLAVLLAAIITGLALARPSHPKHGGVAAPRVATIGVIAPMSGAFSASGQATARAVQLAVKTANDEQLIPGWKLRYAGADDASRPDGGARAADEFRADPTTIGVIGPLSSTVATVALPTLSAAHIPVISPANSDPALTGATAAPRTRPYPSYFRLSGTDVDQAAVAADYAVRTMGRHRIIVVDEGPYYDAGPTPAERFATDARALGATILAYRSVDGENPDPDVASIAEQIEATSPDLVYVSAGSDVATRLRERLARGLLPVTVFGTDGLLDARYLAHAGTDTAGDLATDLAAPLAGLVGARQFVQRYEQGAGSSPTPRPATSGPASSSDGSAPPSPSPPPAPPSPSVSPSVSPSPEPGAEIPPVAAPAYDAAQALLRAAATVLPALPAVTTAARQAVTAAIGRARFTGVTGPVAFDAWGDLVHPVVAVYEVVGEEFVPVLVRRR